MDRRTYLQGILGVSMAVTAPHAVPTAGDDYVRPGSLTYRRVSSDVVNVYGELEGPEDTIVHVSVDFLTDDGEVVKTVRDVVDNTERIFSVIYQGDGDVNDYSLRITDVERL